MGLFDNLVIKHKQDWVPEVFPAGLPAVMPRSWGLQGSLLQGRSSPAWPQLGHQRPQEPWLVWMSWSLDLTPQRRFKIFLNRVFQFWNFWGIPLLQEIWKTCFSTHTWPKTAAFPSSLATQTQQLLTLCHDIQSFYFLILGKYLPPFQPLPLSGFSDSPQFSLLSWEIPPNLQCLFRAAISSKTLTAFTGGQNEYFPHKEPHKCKMIATWIFAHQYLLPKGCTGSALVRNNAQYLAVLQNLASSLLVCLWQITVTLWTAYWTPNMGKMTR